MIDFIISSCITPRCDEQEQRGPCGAGDKWDKWQCLSGELAGPNPAEPWLSPSWLPCSPVQGPGCFSQALEQAARGALIAGLSGDGSRRIIGGSVQRAAVMWSILKNLYDVCDGVSCAGNGHWKRLFCRQSLKECHRLLKLWNKTQVKGTCTFSFILLIWSISLHGKVTRFFSKLFSVLVYLPWDCIWNVCVKKQWCVDWECFNQCNMTMYPLVIKWLQCESSVISCAVVQGSREKILKAAVKVLPKKIISKF